MQFLSIDCKEKTAGARGLLDHPQHRLRLAHYRIHPAAVTRQICSGLFDPDQSLTGAWHLQCSSYAT
jgi:hypothetical protein